jgi:hypothetical protein
MTTLQKTIIDCLTGVIINIDLSADELVQLAADQAQADKNAADKAKADADKAGSTPSGTRQIRFDR